MITIHPQQTLDPIRPINGVNLGPIDRSWGLDYTEHFQRAKVSSVRVHDAPIQMNDVVDLHCIFPSPKLDPDDPDNYFFKPTDDYLAAIRDAGAEIYFRIGETIEHQPTKRYVDPHLWTPEIMAKVVTNIARHYNDGWADGHHWGIKHWEFWNEPENGWRNPPEKRTCWTGSASDYVRFYVAVTGALKNYDPSLHVGLAGFTGGWARLWLEADIDDREAIGGWAGVPREVLDAGASIDFLSWHTYSDSWVPIVEIAGGVRERLDQLGLTAAEQHVTEWNYNPMLHDADGEFSFMQARRNSTYERFVTASAVANGVPGAAYLFGTLAALQDTTVTLAHVYTGISQPFGCFDTSGRPHIKFSGLEAFADFLDPAATRVSVDGTGDHTQALAVRTPTGLRIAVARLDGEDAPQHITVTGIGALEAKSVTARTLTEDGWQQTAPELDDATAALSIPLGSSGLAVVDITTTI